jgi:hypothetical protein
MWFLIALIPAVFCLGEAFADTAGDNFNDKRKDTTKWGRDEVRGHGHLNQTSGRLEYTCGSGTALDSSDRPWIIRYFPTNADWTVQIDATNNTIPSANQYSSFGINVRTAIDQGNEIEVELEAIGQPSGPPARGFLAAFHTYGILAGFAEIATGDISAPLRITFNNTTKVLTVSYFDGSQWVDFGSFGVAGSGGASSNADWGMTDMNQFMAYLFGYSERMAVGDGQLYGDNFSETGGVAPIAIAPGPTGRFRFGFPTNNPLLAIIASIIGHYSGFYPPAAWTGLFNILGIRRYEMDIAQDESGKLSYMGTMDGVTTKDDNTQLSGPIGAMSSVNGKPMAKFKGSFDHKYDGIPGKVTGNANIPVEVINIGGIDSVSGMANDRGKIGSVPFSDKNVPFQVDAPLGAVANLKKDWSFQLDLTGKQDARGKTYIVASLQLLLPNGDTIVFPEKRTNYSTRTGYSLSFTGGTNVTINPPKVDRKTSIKIKGMTLVKQGKVWQPTAGTITYKFLGQQGSGNLLDFIALP